ncbi:hypothetical protein UFOVP49_118 [uncultured Caudovirales phage]|uniref:Uncharacterized protein n=1 Tax=uncultured Caudovirales phage TaxID=2100421 RepID=A0A6J5KVN9_9CAUD|nr:hypothetical protein UFOVP49_118 [uncultured Caudovirales phage]
MFSLIPLPYRILAILLLLVGVFGYGYIKGSHKADVELAAYASKFQALKIALDEEKANIKEKIVTEYVDRIEVVKEKEYVYREKAKTSVPAQYTLSNGWVYLHDVSATGGNADDARTSDATASDVKDNQALGVVVENYSLCRQNAEQLISLQDYITKVKAAVEKANKNPNKK